jgi:3-oxoacyl-[acyl-carrier protein] reductase
VRRTALVTGCGKPDGMGRAIARALSAAGFAVLVTDRQPGGVPNAGQENRGDETPPGLFTLLAELKRDGREAAATLGDIAEPADTRRLVDEATSRFGRLDVLVNNAAAPQGADRQDIEEAPLESWHRQINVNLTGTFLMCRAAVPVMRRQRYGRIVNVSSMAGVTAAPRSAAYSASKAGILGLTRALAMDLGPWGITVNTVCPGLVGTSRGMLNSTPDTDIAAAMAERGKAIPVGRAGSPDDIAGAVAFLASEPASYINGQQLVIDGGGLQPFPLKHPADRRRHEK